MYFELCSNPHTHTVLFFHAMACIHRSIGHQIRSNNQERKFHLLFSEIQYDISCIACLSACQPAYATCIYMRADCLVCEYMFRRHSAIYITSNNRKTKEKRKSKENVFQPSTAKDGKRVFQRFRRFFFLLRSFLA